MAGDALALLSGQDRDSGKLSWTIAFTGSRLNAGLLLRRRAGYLPVRTWGRIFLRRPLLSSWPK